MTVAPPTAVPEKFAPPSETEDRHEVIVNLPAKQLHDIIVDIEYHTFCVYAFYGIISLLLFVILNNLTFLNVNLRHICFGPHFRFCTN